MIELPFRRFRVCMHFSFFATVSLMILLNSGGYAILGLYSCLIHESGHLLVMLITHQEVDRIIFYGGGIKIIQKKQDILTPYSIEAVILVSGCFANFFVFAVTQLFKDNYMLSLFGTINCIIGMFNLLPIKCFDGGKLLILLFYKVCGYNLAVKLEKYLHSITAFLVICIIIVFFAVGYRNFTLYLTLLYLLFSTLIL